MLCERQALRRAVILVVAAAVAAAGDAPEIGVEVRVEPEEVTVGDPITVTVDVTAPRDLSVTFPLVGQKIGSLTVLEAPAPEAPAPDGERLRHRVVYRLAAYQPGETEVPPLEVLIGTGESAESVTTPARSVDVRSVLGRAGAHDEPPDLADIRPQARLPFGLTGWILALLATLLALALLGVWWWRRRRRRHLPEAVPAPGPPPLPADEEALAALERLAEGPLLGQGQVKAFHVELAEIGKRYLWRRYGVPTLERTTFEVLRGARAAAVETSIAEGFGAVLHRCDGVKFARQRPDPAMSRATVRSTRDLVIRSRPGADDAVPAEA